MQHDEGWISTGAAAKLLKSDRKTVLRLVGRGLLVGKQVPTLTGKLWTQVERAQVERLARHKYGWRHHRRGQRVNQEAGE